MVLVPGHIQLTNTRNDGLVMRYCVDPGLCMTVYNN